MSTPKKDLEIVRQERPRAPQGSLKSGSKQPKSSQERPKSDQERPKNAPRAPQERPKSGQERPRAAQERPRAARRGPRKAKSGPNSTESRVGRDRSRPPGCLGLGQLGVSALEAVALAPRGFSSRRLSSMVTGFSFKGKGFSCRVFSSWARGSEASAPWGFSFRELGL